MGNDLERAISDISSHLDYPMFIVTAADDQEIAGCLVGFVTQCSISPARFAVWISKENHTYRVAVNAGLLTVHVVPPDAESLARLFGEKTGDQIDKFSRIEWTRNEAGGIVLAGVGDWFTGRVLDRFDGGDHDGFLVEPIAAVAEGEGFFGFQRAREFEPGHPA